MSKQLRAALLFIGISALIAGIAALLTKDLQYWEIIKTIWKYSFAVYIVGLVFLIFIDHNSPQTTIAWLLIFFVSSYVGFFVYILFGRNLLKRRTARKKSEAAFLTEAELREPCDERVLNRETDEDILKVKRLLQVNSGACLTENNDVTILSDGATKFDYLFKEIEKAKHHIHLEYFILKNDYIGTVLKELLIKKAHLGVQVRLIYDAVGCWKLKKEYINDLKLAGVEIEAFYPVVLPVLSRELNYRNHRKIVVIDGKVGFVGGINVGDEYIGLDKKFGFWRDSHLMIEGAAVRTLQKVFINDWNFITKTLLDDKVYFPAVEEQGREQVQIVESGPDYNWEAIKQAFFTMITGATKSVWITTPYLVPDDAMLMAIRNAALSGVDVRIILPRKADHFLVYWATRDNLEVLLEDGVKIYLYRKGFIHSKTLIADSKVATLGTANLDNRSMGINYEVNAFLYDQDSIMRLEQDFLEDLQYATAINLSNYVKRPIWEKILESIGRLVSPLQ